MSAQDAAALLESLSFAAGTLMRRPKDNDARRAVRTAIAAATEYRHKQAAQRLAVAVDQAERDAPASRLDLDG